MLILDLKRVEVIKCLTALTFCTVISLRYRHEFITDIVLVLCNEALILENSQFVQRNYHFHQSVKIQDWQVLFWFSSFVKRYILYFPRTMAVSSTREIIYKWIYWIKLLGLRHFINNSSDTYLSSVALIFFFFPLNDIVLCYFSLIKQKNNDIFMEEKVTSSCLFLHITCVIFFFYPQIQPE